LNVIAAGNLENYNNPLICAKWQRPRVSVAVVKKYTSRIEIPRHPI